MNYDTFKIQLKAVVKSTFEGCVKRLQVAEIAGFALYSDNSAMSISISLNSFSHLKEMQLEEPGYEVYFKWTPGEWRYEMINNNAFETLNRLLQSAHAKVPDASFVQHRNKVYNAAVEVLEDLNKEGLFKEMAEDFVLTFAVSDFSDIELEVSWVKRLNPDKKSCEFERWIRS